MSATTLDRVRSSADAAADARSLLLDAIVAARAEGATLRAIADAAQLSPEWVRQLVAKD